MGLKNTLNKKTEVAVKKLSFFYSYFSVYRERMGNVISFFALFLL